ncbi:hypothetical protein K8R03_00195 [Candidatus Kaiserbacteria bacterium]|nr:hypothetical protein [Candidatus Kaiserbacteria bacterium]
MAAAPHGHSHTGSAAWRKATASLAVSGLFALGFTLIAGYVFVTFVGRAVEFGGAHYAETAAMTGLLAVFAAVVTGVLTVILILRVIDANIETSP